MATAFTSLNWNGLHVGIRHAINASIKFSIVALVGFAFTGGASHASAQPLPKGIMLNLDFEQAVDGLIPSKAMFNLHVPQQDLGIEYLDHRYMLAVREGQGLDIPHSSLIEPNGDEWILTIRVFALTDGLILSQADEEHGVAIYMKDGHIEAALRSGLSTVILKENELYGRTKYHKRWVTIELRVKDGFALLNLNRKRVAMIMDQPALDGENMRIRLGSHRGLPAPLENLSGMRPDGFSGAISSFKILRQ